MNVSIRIDLATMALLDELVKSEKRSRSAVIREAVRELANRKQPKKRWPPDVAVFLANPQSLDGEFAGFEAYRAEMLTLDTVPFIALSKLAATHRT